MCSRNLTIYLLFTGTSAKREREIIVQLNREFFEFLAEGKPMKEAYSLLVNNYPYRILSNASYDWEENPIDDVSFNQDDGEMSMSILTQKDDDKSNDSVENNIENVDNSRDGSGSTSDHDDNNNSNEVVNNEVVTNDNHNNNNSSSGSNNVETPTRTFSAPLRVQHVQNVTSMNEVKSSIHLQCMITSVSPIRFFLN